MPGIGKIVVFLLLGLMAATVFLPTVRQLFTRMFSNGETITLASPQVGPPRELEIITLLGYDAIPAILSPRFVDANEAEAWMEPDEQVLGLSINGDNRAYSIRMLSRHEIVNDEVGGTPVAVTW